MSYAAILYVSSACAASRRLLASVVGDRDKTVFVQSVDELDPADVPEWLDGTPLLVVTNSGAIARGRRAIGSLLGALP